MFCIEFIKKFDLSVNLFFFDLKASDDAIIYINNNSSH
jgi:hypothetical protein